jgi:hypothetical protein
VPRSLRHVLHGIAGRRRDETLRSDEIVALSGAVRDIAQNIPESLHDLSVAAGATADRKRIGVNVDTASPEAQSALAPVTSSERFELLNIDVLSRLVVNGAGEFGAIMAASCQQQSLITLMPTQPSS